MCEIFTKKIGGIMKSKKSDPRKQKWINCKEKTFRNSLILGEEPGIFCSNIHTGNPSPKRLYYDPLVCDELQNSETLAKGIFFRLIPEDYGCLKKIKNPSVKGTEDRHRPISEM